MPTPTYKAIQTIAPTNSVSTLTFSSIPQTYTDLILVGNVLGSQSSLMFTTNNASLYQSITLNSSTSSVNTRNNQDTNIFRTVDNDNSVGTVGNTLASVRIEFFNYSLSGTTGHRPVLFRIGRSGVQQSNGTGMIETSGAAITTITLSLSNGGFSVGSTFTLYGIA